MKTYFCVHFGAAILAIAVTPLAIWLARATNAVDYPGIRKVHDRPIPRIGGIAIYLSTVSLVLAVLFLDNNIGDAFRAMPLQLTAVLCTGTFIFLIGLADDLRRLPARFKFIAESCAAIVLCCTGVRIDSLGIPDVFTWHLGGLGCVLTVLWVVGITNAVNLSDGLDGLAAGISTVACGVIAIYAIRTGEQEVLAVFMLALAGSLMGFLVFNFNPARVFMGDCGSLFVGYVIAATSVLCVAKSAAVVGLALPAIALGIPIFDTLFSMLRRFLERRSLCAPDQDHFHHRLLALGLRQRHVVVAIYLATLVCAGLSLFMLVREDLGILVIFGCILLLLLVLFRVVGTVQLRQIVARLQEKHTLAHCQRCEREIFERLQLEFRRIRDGDAWWNTVCKAAQGMEFAWISWKTVGESGETYEEVWRATLPKPGASRMMTTRIPLVNGKNGQSGEIEVGVWTNGFVEAAARRITLFGRLLDEHGVADSDRASSREIRAIHGRGSSVEVSPRLPTAL